MKSKTELSREEVAISIFAAMLPRALDKADAMAFPEGALKYIKLEISAAWSMADMWIFERQDSESRSLEVACPKCKGDGFFESMPGDFTSHLTNRLRALYAQ